MVQFCCVVGCGNRSNRDKKHFFCLPNVPKNCNKVTYKADIIMNMRKQWLMNINRDDLKDGDAAYSPRYIRVCSDHFVSGKPSAWYDVGSVDWAPTINMGYNPRKRRRLLGSKIHPNRGRIHSSTFLKRRLKELDLKKKQRILKLLSLQTKSDYIYSVTQHPVIHRITTDSIIREETNEDDHDIHKLEESILSSLEDIKQETVSNLKSIQESEDKEAGTVSELRSVQESENNEIKNYVIINI